MIVRLFPAVIVLAALAGELLPRFIDASHRSIHHAILAVFLPYCAAVAWLARPEGPAPAEPPADPETGPAEPAA